MENTKRDLSLDFTKPRQPRGGCQTVPSLMTPILNLSTPELSKHLVSISEEELAVLTPNGISSVIPQSNVLPSPLIPTTVNSNNIINTASHNNSNSGSQNSNCKSNFNSNTNNNLQNSNKCNGNQNHSQKKRSDKNRDIDVEKIEKKRERNRLAAKKCRQRKVETIDELRKTLAERDSEIAELKQDLSERDLRYQKLEMAFEDFKNFTSRELEALTRDNAELKCLNARRS